MSDILLTVPVPAQQRPTPDMTPAEPADAAALLAAADATADALADSLHDGALQALVVARYAADAAVRGGDTVAARDAVQEALTALRHAVWLLRPRGGDDLAAALDDLSTRLPLQLDLDAEVASALAPAARALAYRFVQAAAGAAGAAAPAVVLSRDGASAALTVDGALADVDGWSARARAVAGSLDRPAGPARLLLPLPDSDPEGDR